MSLPDSMDPGGLRGFQGFGGVLMAMGGDFRDEVHDLQRAAEIQGHVPQLKLHSPDCTDCHFTIS